MINSKIVIVIFMTVFMSMFAITGYAGNNNDWRCDALQSEYKLSDTQLYNMHRSYQYAKKDNLGWTLAAISFRESSGGMALVNWNDPSAGHHHVLAKYVMKEFGMTNTPENIAIAMEMLSSNFYLSAHFAVRELKWWKKKHKGDFFKTWRSYNQGYYWLLTDINARKRSFGYATDIGNMIKFMKDNCTKWK